MDCQKSVIWPGFAPVDAVKDKDNRYNREELMISEFFDAAFFLRFCKQKTENSYQRSAENGENLAKYHVIFGGRHSWFPFSK